jgi:hypothetical protein
LISSWLVKIVLGIALIGAAVLELGSPLIAKAQADDAAHNIADEVAFRLTAHNTKAELDDACKTESAKESVEVLQCTVDSKGDVVVRVRKDARSLVLKRWSATEDWYHPEVTATANGPGG